MFCFINPLSYIKRLSLAAGDRLQFFSQATVTNAKTQKAATISDFMVCGLLSDGKKSVKDCTSSLLPKFKIGIELCSSSNILLSVSVGT
jgi:hypothetical protein